MSQLRQVNCSMTDYCSDTNFIGVTDQSKHNHSNSFELKQNHQSRSIGPTKLSKEICRKSLIDAYKTDYELNVYRKPIKLGNADFGKFSTEIKFNKRSKTKLQRSDIMSIRRNISPYRTSSKCIEGSVMSERSSHTSSNFHTKGSLSHIPQPRNINL